MSICEAVKGLISMKFNVTEISDGDALKMLFDVGGGRSQLVFVEHAYNDQADYIQVLSPVGDIPQVNIVEVARDVGKKVLGGVVLVDDRVYLTHSAPLADIDENEILEPIHRICAMADELEQHYLGTDEF